MRLSKSTIRQLDQLGLRAIPSRVRNSDDIRFGGFMIVDNETNALMEGGSPFPFSLSADDVRDFVNELNG